jgi:hypothetical protein
LSILALSFACELRDQDPELITVYGSISDQLTGEAIASVPINIDAIKSASSMGIITDGRRVTAGQITTDLKGNYKATLRTFEGAETLEFMINSSHEKVGYTETKHFIGISDLHNQSNQLDFTLSPTALLRFKIRNADPVADTDYFTLWWHDRIIEWPRGWTRDIVEKENCGIVKENGLTWIGKDVCAIYTLEAIAEDYVFFYWTVKEDEVTNEYKDSIYMKRGVVKEYSLNY